MNLKIILLLTITTNTLSYVCSKTIFVNPYKSVSVNDNETMEFPTQRDFNAYMNSLRGIIRFCYENKEDIDMNLAFGLFLVHVNLQTALHRKSLPKDLAQELKGMSESVVALLDFFRTMVIRDCESADQNSKGIATLFWDEVPWVERVEDLSRPLPLDNNWQGPRFRSWEEYERAMLDLDNTAMPGPEESDICISSLASSRVNQTADIRICSLHPACLPILRDGSYYGYSLTHRLLLLLFAQFGRDCSVLSPEQHRAMVSRFCTIAYGEAQSIAENHFGDFIDLFMEQISACSIAGFGQFVRRSWLATILEHQQAEGCFGQTKSRGRQRPMKNKRRWALEKTKFNHDSLDIICNGHVTAVAAGAISAGVRMFIEITFSDNELYNV